MSQKVITDDVLTWTDLLPNEQYTATSLASGTLPASAVAGAQEVYLLSSGATALTLPPAASVYALIQNAVAGVTTEFTPSFNYYLRILNTNGGTLTLTAGTGNTITGASSLATTVTRDYIVTVTSPGSAVYQFVGSGSTT